MPVEPTAADHRKSRAFIAAFGHGILPVARPRIDQAFRDALVTERREAADIIEDLLAVQNGPPLEKYRDDWEAAMARARAFVDANRPAEPVAQLADTPMACQPGVCCNCGAEHSAVPGTCTMNGGVHCGHYREGVYPA